MVSNACGTLWNLSARCKEDQMILRDLGAVPMLRNLVHSRHKMIAMGSSAALKNLDSAGITSMVNSQASSSGSNTLLARKQKALEQEIDHTLTEMCDNIDPASPTEENAGDTNPFDRRMYRSLGGCNPYSRSATSVLLSKNNLVTPNKQIRSSSLERSCNRIPLNDDPVVAGAVPPATGLRTAGSPAATRLQVSRTAWRSHEDEISYTALNYEEDDQPVNYSLKYTEEVATVSATRWTSSSGQVTEVTEKSIIATEAPGEKMDPSSVKKVMVYSAYRETDLDEPEQPTDFSLRYQEDEDYTTSGDTMKTYYIEGTPYETPFNCSSAASLTDLREAGFEESKGDASPKEEARTDELGSQTPNLQMDKNEKTPPLSRRTATKEGKTVTFNTEDNNYAEQTPLMFSRCSSMESLGSIDQQQINDEGSIVSEFSRLTSRAVSPSELPDSPGQTMPPSPRRPQPPEQKKNRSMQQDQQQQQEQQQQQQEQQKQQQQQQTMQHHQQQRNDVFGDAVNNFVLEGTPALTRAASPLSQLSFGDEPAPIDMPADLPVKVSTNFVSEPVNLINPIVSRVARSCSEINFRNVFLDEV